MPCLFARFPFVCYSGCPFVRKNFNIGHNFLMITKSFHIVHVYFSLIPRSRSSVKVKVKYTGHNFQKMAVAGALCFAVSVILFTFEHVAVHGHEKEHRPLYYKFLISNLRAGVKLGIFICLHI